MYRRCLFAVLVLLMTPAVAREPSPMVGRPFNREINTDLVRIADLARAQSAVDLLPEQRRAAAKASLAAELQMLTERVARSLAM
jgi:hypothetical protein